MTETTTKDFIRGGAFLIEDIEALVYLRRKTFPMNRK